jgi:glycerophosphoryl diester phosphodiesterase
MIHRNAIMMIRLSVTAASLINIGIAAPASEAADSSKSCLRTPKHGGVYVVAHRGAHNGIPENSLAAYEKAIELGVDFVEIDIRATRDGKLVSIHNASIDAYVEGASGKVRGFTLDELRALDIGSRVGKQWKGTRIPTLEEVLALCKGKCGIYLDLKEPAIIFDVAKTVHESGMEHDVLWYGPIFFLGVLKELQRRYPECIVMPDPIREMGIPLVVKGLQPKVIAATWDNYSKSFVDKCHAAGAIVIVDESDQSCWEEAIAWGSNGIQTDHPAKLIRFLKARKVEE